MNTIFKNSALIVLSLCLAACVKESPSLFYIERAYKEALKLHREGNLNDALAQSAQLLAQGQALPEALHRRLAHLAADTSALWKRQILALRLLALQDTSYLPTYLRMQDEYWTTRFRTFMDEAEREKKGLIAERDAIAAGQKHTLFIALTLFALLLGGGLYAVAGHRRKHELERVRLILGQKEQAIQILEGQQEDTERLRRQILEKEKRMEELVQRERKLQELSSLAQGKEKDLARFSRLTREIDELRHRIEQKQLEWKEKEAQIRRHHLYDLPISHRLPVADNPHQPRKEDFDGFVGQQRKADGVLAGNGPLLQPLCRRTESPHSGTDGRGGSVLLPFPAERPAHRHRRPHGHQPEQRIQKTHTD